MAKVLKFGLMLDDCNVRSLEGLQEHFVIEDVLKYFEDGTLSRWLKVWGYKEQLAAVEAIDKALDKKDIVLQLANIFGIENVDAADIEKALSVFSYLEKKQKFQVTVQENALFKKQAVEEYLAGYEALIQDMINKAKGLEKEDFLKRMLIGNILSLSKGLKYTVEKEIKVRLNVKEEVLHFKGNKMAGFIGEFYVNFEIPDYMALGKGISRGFGTIQKVK